MMKKRNVFAIMVVCFLFVFAMSGAVFAADESEGSVTLSGNDWLTESQVMYAADVLGVPDDFSGSYNQIWESDNSSVIDLAFYYGQNQVARAIVGLYSGNIIDVIQYYTPAVFSFKDTVPGDWYYEAVKSVYDLGIMYGTGLEYFEPNTVTNRAMLATILYRMEGSPAVYGSNPFVDVPAGQWYTDAIIWASQNGIVNGFGNGLFKPNDPITREQMAVMLYRFAGYKDYMFLEFGWIDMPLLGVGAPNIILIDSSAVNEFSDAPFINDYAVDAVQWAVSDGLITGMTPTTIVPQGQATRAQMATILGRFIEYYY